MAAVHRGRVDEGLQRLAQIDLLMPRLSLPTRAAAPELGAVLQSARGMLELWNGAPDRARRAWETGARGFHPRAAHRSLPAHLAAADCLGQLAFLEAVAGETNRALRHVGDVLAVGPAGRGRTGAVFAQLAAVWAQINGAELEAAGDRLDAVVERYCGTVDVAVPAGLAATVALVGARLAAVTGSGQVSGNVSLIRGGVLTGWFADQLVAIRTEAELVVGEPASAVQVLTGADLAGAEGHVLRALALLEQGDLGSAAACLRTRPVDTISTVSQIQIELIEARLTLSGDRKHVRSLVDRALRAAQREVLRVPVAWAKSWLGPVVMGDPLLGATVRRLPRLDPFDGRRAVVGHARPVGTASRHRARRRTGRAAQPARAGGAAAARLDEHQHRDRGRAVLVGEHREDPPQRRLSQARGEPAFGGCASRPRARPVLRPAPGWSVPGLVGTGLS